MKKILLTIIVLLISIANIYCGSSSKQSPKVIKGVLDLTNWNLNKDGILKLDGEWEFYWNQFLTSEDFKKQNFVSYPENDKSPTKLKSKSFGKQYVKIPHSWNGIVIGKEKLQGNGYASYRLRIHSPGYSLDNLAFKFQSESTAFSVYANGNNILQVGTVAKNKEKMIPRFYPDSIHYDTKNNNIELIIHVSNFYHSKGGLWNSIWMGNQKDIKSLKEKLISIDIFLVGSILIMGLYHLGLFFVLREDKSPLYFGILCILIVLRTLTINERFIMHIIPSMNWEALVRLEYLSAYFAYPVFGIFSYIVFPKNISKSIIKTVIIVACFFSLIVFFSNAEFYTSTVKYYQMILTIIGIYIFYSISKACYQKIEGSTIFLFGFILVFATVINDFLHANEIIRTMNLSHFGLFALILSQSILLSTRFSKSFHKVKILSTELEKNNIQLLKLDKLKDEFLANTSHEFKTPLNGIIGLSDNLLNGLVGSLSVKQKKHVNLIKSSSERLFFMVNDILDFSKLQKDDIYLHFKKLDLYSTVNVALMLLDPLVWNKNIKLISKVKKSTKKIWADEDRLLQILLNLISNAIKFSEKGQITISSKILKKTNPQSVEFMEITVEDTGIGILESNYKIIFESFIQVESTNSRKYEGSGLGLAISQKFVQLHGGQIHVISKVSKGSKFIFTIPLYNKNSSTRMNKITRSSQSFHKNTNKQALPTTDRIILDGKNTLVNLLSENRNPDSTIKILAVDDDITNLQIIIDRLSLKGYSVQALNNGQDVLNTVLSEKNKKKNKYNLIILDIMMPEISGYEVCEKIREHFSLQELPVIFLTAKNRDADIQAGFQHGGNDFISKPFSKDELLSRVELHLNLAKTSAELKSFTNNLESKVIERTNELNEKNNQNKSIIELSPYLIAIAKAGKILFVNNAGSNLLGYDNPESLFGCSLAGLTNTNYKSTLKKYFQTIREPKNRQPGIHEHLLRKDGISIEIELSIRQISYNKQKAILIIGRDITEKKRIEDIRKDTERIFRHDLKTPVIGMINVTEGLMSKLKDNENVEYIKLMNEGAKQMRSMIDSSFDLILLEDGNYSLNTQSICVYQNIKIVCENLKDFIDSKKLEIEYSYGLAKNKIDKNTFPITADNLLIERLFTNLIKNALEASPYEGKISINISNEIKNCIIDIHNRGMVPDEIQNTFFNKYSTSSKEDGTGLGTYSAMLIAKRHSGNIEFTSTEKEGTHLIITLGKVN